MCKIRNFVFFLLFAFGCNNGEALDESLKESKAKMKDLVYEGNIIKQENEHLNSSKNFLNCDLHKKTEELVN